MNKKIWHYICAECGRHTISSDAALTHCTVPLGPVQVTYPQDHPTCGSEYEDGPYIYLSDLIENGLLVTDEIHTVIDTAVAHRDAPKGDWWQELHAAVGAYLRATYLNGDDQ